LKYNLALQTDKQRLVIENHKQACLATHQITRVANGTLLSSELSAWYKKQSTAWREEFGPWFNASLSDANFYRNQRR
jgi:hypothetical protein